MAVQSPPYVLQNAAHQAILFRQTSSAFVDNEGVVNATDLAVTANSTPAMNVDVATGSCWVYGDYSTDSQYYFAHNEGAVNLAIASSDASNPRIDIVVAQINDSAYSGSADDWELSVITGTPAGSPSAPSLPSSALKLATIAVGATVTTIVSGNITDERSVSELSVEGGINISANTPDSTTNRLYNIGGSLYWSGTAVALGDITGVTAGNGLSGGGTSGTVTLALDLNELSTATAIATDYVAIEDVGDGSSKKALISDIVALAGDITGVTAGTAMSGGGASGAVTVNVDVNAAGSVTAVASDYVLIEDIGDNTTKKALISDIVALAPTGDITEVNTAANSSLAGGATSGAVTLTASVHNSTVATAVGADYVLIADTNDSNATKKALISDITALAPAGTVTSVTGTAPVASSGGATPAISVNTSSDQLILSNQVFSG